MPNYGKITRLPHDLREQLNLRILDHEPPEHTLQWLNALPQLQAILAQHFQGQPVSSANLSDYKLHHGYRDWLDRREARELALSLDDHPQGPEDPALAKLTPQLLNRSLLIRLAARAQNLPDPDTQPELHWTRLHQLIGATSRMRRDNLRQDTLELDQQNLALSQAQVQQRTEQAHQAWSRRPEVRAQLYRGLAPDTIALIERDRGISPPPLTFDLNPKTPNP